MGLCFASHSPNSTVYSLTIKLPGYCMAFKDLSSLALVLSPPLPFSPAARRSRLSQRLILISFGPLLSLRLLLRLLFRQHKLAGRLALLSIDIIPYEIKRSVAKHE